MSAAALRPGRPSGRAAAVGSEQRLSTRRCGRVVALNEGAPRHRGCIGAHMWGNFSVANGGRSRQRCQIGARRCVGFLQRHPAGSHSPGRPDPQDQLKHAPRSVSSNRARPGRRPDTSLSQGVDDVTGSRTRSDQSRSGRGGSPRPMPLCLGPLGSSPPWPGVFGS